MFLAKRYWSKHFFTSRFFVAFSANKRPSLNNCVEDNEGRRVHTHSDGSGLQKLPDKKLTGNKKARLGSQETQALGLNSETAIISGFKGNSSNGPVF